MTLFSPVECRIAWRYLRAKRQEGFISVISWFSLTGIALGVATLIVVMAVMNGFRAELFQRVLGLNGHINVFARSGGLTDWQELATTLRGVSGVLHVTPLVEGQTLVTHGGSASGAMVRGVDSQDFQQRPVIAEHIVAGRLEDLTDGNVAIGGRMAQRLGLRLGDPLTLVAPRGNATVFGTAPRMKSMIVAAIFDVGMYEYDNGFVFMTLNDAQALLSLGRTITSLEIFTDNPYDVRPIMARLSEAMASKNVRLVDWQQAHASFSNAIEVQRNVLFFILTLMILVAALNIISGLTMLVQDKGRDIAILRTLGMTRLSIMRVFFLCGATIGITGTLVGMVIGVAFARNIETIRQALQSLTGTNLFAAEIYFLSHLPARLDGHDVLQVVAMALGLSFLATLYPSWRAARLDPVEALRHE